MDNKAMRMRVLCTKAITVVVPERKGNRTGARKTFEKTQIIFCAINGRLYGKENLWGAIKQPL